MRAAQRDRQRKREEGKGKGMKEIYAWNVLWYFVCGKLNEFQPKTVILFISHRNINGGCCCIKTMPACLALFSSHETDAIKAIFLFVMCVCNVHSRTLRSALPLISANIIIRPLQRAVYVWVSEHVCVILSYLVVLCAYDMNRVMWFLCTYSLLLPFTPSHLQLSPPPPSLFVSHEQ